jgi:hypothetical protein
METVSYEACQSLSHGLQSRQPVCGRKVVPGGFGAFLFFGSRIPGQKSTEAGRGI